MKDSKSAGHSNEDLFRLTEIRDRLTGISPLKPTVLVDDVTGYYVVMIPSHTPQFYRSQEEAVQALPPDEG